MMKSIHNHLRIRLPALLLSLIAVSGMLFGLVEKTKTHPERLPPDNVEANRTDAPELNNIPHHSHALAATREAISLPRSELDEWLALAPGQNFAIAVSSDERLKAVATRRWQSDGEELLSANVIGGGTIGFRTDEAGFCGLIQIPSRNQAFILSATVDADIRIQERLLSDVVCAKPIEGNLKILGNQPVTTGIPRPTNETFTAFSGGGGPSPTSVPVLQSRTSATAVIYIDLDGETVNDPLWNGGSTIVAPAARLNDSQITEVWRRVVQDYSVFDVNVTTVLDDYNNAPANRRTHCVVTANDAASPGAGGVAYVGSFTGIWSPICWSFIDDEAKACAEVISHEVGHTLGLYHDGRTSPPEEYYAGHGSGITGWAPIMGVGYYREFVQWSKGEYANANNSEDDLAIISALIAYLADDHGSTTGTASAVVGPSATGLIEVNTNVDYFSVTLTAGTYTIYLQPDTHGNLDGLLEVFNESGGLITTFNEYALVSENRLTAIDKEIPMDIAALMGCAVTTGLGVVFNEAKLRPGESIAVLGCGGVGLNVIQGASLLSAWPIYAFDMVEDRLDMAKKFGADETINAKEHRFFTGRIDVVVDCTGQVGLIEQGLNITAPRGRMILVGLPHGRQNSTIQFNDMRQHFTGKKIIFSEGGSTEPNTDIPIYLRMHKAGMLKLKELITHRYPLDKINDALDTLRTGECGRCVVEMP
ncbi:MAG: zinc-binding dehydrogenase [Verrucomicrobia bacterium]|nr:zinc-binding dehydrogenase [Verrucomicrobiota bacterium]